MVLQEPFKQVSRGIFRKCKEQFKFHGSLKDVLKVLPGRVSGKCSRCFIEISCCMALIAPSQAEGGLVCKAMFMWELGLGSKKYSACKNFSLASWTGLFDFGIGYVEPGVLCFGR